MRIRHATTLSGLAAGGCYTAAQTPGLPNWMTLAAHIGAALAMASLGWHATPCPPACPGTDHRGRPRPPRSALLLSALMLIASWLAIFSLTGCVTRNPAADPAHPDAPAYVPDPRIGAWSNAVVPIASTTGTATGTGPALETVAAAVFGLVAAISAVIARKRSQVAKTLAAAIHDAGPDAVADAMAYASDGPNYGAVADSLRDHCATGQAPGYPQTQEDS